ncbi:MAG TPA: hypothetical protein VM029_08685 [Opitutaceae bacterium]|nr:hypothetical protein [Opitutaceae bacterium]
MDSSDDITSRILESLGALSAEEQAEAIIAVISSAIKGMSVYRILEIRSEIVAELDPSLAVVDAALNLIDGQLAVREIGGDDVWR